MRQVTIELYSVKIFDLECLANIKQTELDLITRHYKDADELIDDCHDNGMIVIPFCGNIRQTVNSQWSGNLGIQLIDGEVIRVTNNVFDRRASLYIGLKNCTVEHVEDL